jgi:hypothetical protein
LADKDPKKFSEQIFRQAKANTRATSKWVPDEKRVSYTKAEAAELMERLYRAIQSGVLEPIEIDIANKALDSLAKYNSLSSRQAQSLDRMWTTLPLRSPTIRP